MANKLIWYIPDRLQLVRCIGALKFAHIQPDQAADRHPVEMGKHLP